MPSCDLHQGIYIGSTSTAYMDAVHLQRVRHILQGLEATYRSLCDEEELEELLDAAAGFFAAPANTSNRRALSNTRPSVEASSSSRAPSRPFYTLLSLALHRQLARAQSSEAHPDDWAMLTAAWPMLEVLATRSTLDTGAKDVFLTTQTTGDTSSPSEVETDQTQTSL